MVSRVWAGRFRVRFLAGAKAPPTLPPQIVSNPSVGATYPHSSQVRSRGLKQCISTAGPRPGTGPWHQLHRAARGSPGICHFSFLRNFHE